MSRPRTHVTQTQDEEKRKQKLVLVAKNITITGKLFFLNMYSFTGYYKYNTNEGIIR